MAIIHKVNAFHIQAYVLQVLITITSNLYLRFRFKCYAS